MHFAHSPVSHLAHQGNCLQPAETFLDPLPLLLTEGVCGVPRGATVNRTAATRLVILGHVRRDPQVQALGHKAMRVEPFVAAHRHRFRSRNLFQNHQRCIAHPLAWNTSASTIKPLRFSTNRFPL